MSSSDFKDFKTEDVEPLLANLKDLSLSEKASRDKIKLALKTLWNLCLESLDLTREVVNNNAVEILITLFNSPNGKSFKEEIVSILVLLSKGKKSAKTTAGDIAILALCNILADSEVNISLECLSAIRDVAVYPNKLSNLAETIPYSESSALSLSSSSSTPSSSHTSSLGRSTSSISSSTPTSTSPSSSSSSTPSSSPTATPAHSSSSSSPSRSSSSPSSSPSSSSLSLTTTSSRGGALPAPATALIASHFLTVATSAVLLENATAVLSSRAPNRTKQDIMDALLDLVGSGAMNEAAEFAWWREMMGVGGGGGGGGGGDGEEKVGVVPAVRFSGAFKAFGKIVEWLWLNKRIAVLACAAERIHFLIKENKFFPTANAPQSFPLLFLPNPQATNVTISGRLLTWNSNDHRTLFVDPEIVEGIYKVTLSANGNHAFGILMFGLCAKGVMAQVAGTHIRAVSSGTCTVEYDGIYCAASRVVSSPLFAQAGDVNVGLELNANTHQLYFFLNGSQLPYSVVNVPQSVHFGVSAYTKNGTVELKSLERLAAPSISMTLTCAKYEWK